MDEPRQHESSGDPLTLEIIIVAYQSRTLLDACLRSVERFPASNGKTIVHVIDNASSDGTPEMIRHCFPAVRYVWLPENVGFSAANNVALANVTAPYVLLLNPDAELRDGVLDHGLSVLESDPSVGVLGCRLERLDGSFDHAAKRQFPTVVGAIAHFVGVGRGTAARHRFAQYRAPDVAERESGDVDAVNGAFMLVRREAMEQVGLLDAGYWMYGEDLDWCLRFARAGWRVVYDGRVTAIHVKGGTAGSHRRVRQNVAFHQAMGRFYRKFYAGKHPWLDALVYSGIVAKLLVSLAITPLRAHAGTR